MERDIFGAQHLADSLAPGLQLADLVFVGMFTLGVTGCYAFAKDCNVYCVPFIGKTAYGSATAKNLVVRMGCNYKYPITHDMPPKA
jgi:hypothetical protein